MKIQCFLNNRYAILNNSQVAFVQGNYITGDSNFNGFCFGILEANNFQDIIYVINPASDDAQFSNAFNIFDNYLIDNDNEDINIVLSQNNAYTFVECNLFDSDGTSNLYCVFSEASDLPLSWGLPNFSLGYPNGLPSGNSHTNPTGTLAPIFYSDTDIVNYHKQGNNEIFLVEQNFVMGQLPIEAE